MANSYQVFSGPTVVNNSFPLTQIDGYLEEGHLKVYKNNILQTSGYSFTNPGTLTLSFTTAPAASDVIKVQRQTPNTVAGRVVDFSDGSVLTAADLDESAIQLLYLVQESNDTGSGALGPNSDGSHWDAGSKKIQNLASPTASTDAANKAYVDGVTLYGTGLSSPQSWTLSGTGSATSFTLSPAPLTTDANMFLVEVGGVIQRPTNNYSIAAPNTLVFTSAPGAGSGNIVVRNIGAVRNVAAFADNVSFGSNISVAGTAAITGNTTVTGSVTSSSFVGPVTGNVTGNLTGNVTGNVVATNLTGTLQTAAQPNITSTGALTVPSISVTGSITGSTVGALAASLLPSGSVLQVVVGAENATALSLSASYQASAVTVSITPKRASSRIVLIASVNTAITAASGGGTFVNLYIYKTAIGTSVGGGANFNYAMPSTFSQHNGIIMGTDFANTTSAITYGIAANFSGTTPSNSYVNGNSGTSRIVAIEVAV